MPDDRGAEREARDQGIQQAIDHAEAVVPGWVDQAFAALVDFLTINPRHRGVGFTSEQVREHAAKLGVPQPPHLRSWGGVMRRAAREGVIVKAGITESKAAHCHCSHVGLWRGA